MHLSIRPLGTGGTSGPQLNFSWATPRHEFWFEVDIHVPANFHHRNNYNPETSESLPDNNKLFIFFAGTYSSGTNQPGCELNPSVISGTSAADGTSRIRNTVRYTTDPNPTSIETIPGYAFTLIGPSGPCAPGNWSTIRFHHKRCSSYGVYDGVWEMWANGSKLARIVRDFGSALSESFDIGVTRGYLLGWANSGFTEDTTFHVQRIAFYDTDPGWG